MKETVIGTRPSFVFDGEHRYDSGGFIVNDQKLEVDEPQFWPLLVTTQRQCTLKKTILESISSAKDYVKVCSFILDDQETLDALSKRARSGEIAVFVLTNLNRSTFERSLMRDADEEERGGTLERFKTHHDGIRRLSDAGAYVHASTESHAKFIIADGNSGILMSANLTYNSLNKNYESGLRLSVPDAKFLERLFDAIFQRGSKYGAFERLGNEYYVVEKDLKLSLSDFEDLVQGGLLWTFTKISDSLKRGLEGIIKAAHTDLLLSTFSVVQLDSLGSIRDSIQEFTRTRGGRACFLTRANASRSDHAMGCLSIAKLGCEIYGDLVNHSKGVIADSSNGLLFTANLDGQHGLTAGFEVGVDLLSYPEVLKSFRRFMQWQIDSAPYKYSLSPSHEQNKVFFKDMYGRKGIVARTSCTLDRLVTVSGSQENIMRLRQALQWAAPFLREPDTPQNPEVIDLRVGNNIFTVRKLATNEFHLDKIVQSAGHQRELFFDYDQLTIVAKKEGAR